MADFDPSRARWRKSSRSAPTEANCVEVALSDESVAARDSKNPEAGVLAFSAQRWADFLDGLRRGRFDI